MLRTITLHGRDRRLDLDWVRVGAFGLLVLYHVGMYYVSWDWHVKSPAAGPAIEPFMFLTSPWRLTLLFLVSGAASAYLFEKRTDGFMGDRSRRLLLPLLFGMAVIVVPQAYYEVVDKLPGGYRDGYWAFYGRYLTADDTFCSYDDCLVLPTWNHLWFLAYLFVYSAVVWLALRVSSFTLRERAGRWLAGMCIGIGVLVAPMVWLMLARLLLVARFGSTHALIDDWYNHAQYFPMFVLGFALARAESFWLALERCRWASLAVAVPTCAFIAWYFTWSGFVESPPDGLRVAQRLLWAANQWAATAAILGFAYRLRHFDHPLLRYLTPAVLPVYILHQTIIVVLAHNLQRLRMSPVTEGTMLVALTFALSFLGYEFVRRIRWLRPLFGLRWGAPPSPASRRSIHY